MELFTTLKRFIQEEHLWHSKVCTKKRSDSSDGLLNENSTPSTPLTPPDNLASTDKGNTNSLEQQDISEETMLYSL